MGFQRIIGGLLKLMGNTDGKPIGNAEDALNVNLRDTTGNAAGTISNPIYVSGATGQGRVAVNEYNQIAAVASGITTDLILFTIPDDSNYALERISVSGDNIALFQVLINDVKIETQRTFIGGDLNTEFNFLSTTTIGYPLTEGDVVKVTVLQNRPDAGNYECRLQISKTS